MLMVKSNADTEAGKVPSMELVEAMGKFNEEMVKAGVLLAAEGLQASSKGAKIKFAPAQKPVAVDGPFTETKELIAGFWLIQVKSKEEAIAWALRSPAPHGRDEPAEIEIRRVYDPSDFGTAENEQALRDEIAKRTLK